MVECTLHMHVLCNDCPEFRDEGGENVKPEKFQFLEKGKNRNFGYEIVIRLKKFGIYSLGLN